MRVYVNYGSRFRIMLVFGNILYVSMTIIRLLTFQIEDSIDVIVMCSCLIGIVLLVDFSFLYMKDSLNITKYDELHIVSRFIFRKKTIQYSDIKQLVLVGNSIVILTNAVDLTNINKRGNILRRYFKGKIMFYLGNDEKLFLIISNKANCELYCIGKESNASKRLGKYFKIIYV